MKAIYNRELDSYFHSGASYFFAAFLLLFVGFAALYYNVNKAVANFEYVLGTIDLAFVIIVPFISMRSITEERRQKTDQLLYSLPLDMSEIVLGKYFALLTIFCIPMIVVAIYPLVFSKYGDVYLLTSYGSMFAFILLGAAWLAVGLFISSLTDRLAVSAGVTALIILANYYSTALADKIGVDFISKLASWTSLFDHFYIFVNGIFDLGAVIYFLSIIALFIFLTIMSLEKRRYN